MDLEERLASFENATSNEIIEIVAKINDEFCDVLIDCHSIYLPAHKYVLCARSEVLAEQLSSGFFELNWTGYGVNTSVALLRWIYTDDIVLDNDTLVGLLSASYHLHLATLFETCERALISSVDEGTCIEIGDVAKKVGANKLVAKCLEFEQFESIHSDRPKESIVETIIDNEMEIDTDGGRHAITNYEQRLAYLDEQRKLLNKLSGGYCYFRKLADTPVVTDDDDWIGHGYFLSTRGAKIRDEIQKNNELDFRGIQESHAFRQWLYTDTIDLDDENVAVECLNFANKYELTTLFEQCEQALVEKIDIHSCTILHDKAAKLDAKALSRSCNQFFASFTDSLRGMVTVQELPVEGIAEGLLILNDDCLIDIFRFLSVDDLGSIKDTCSRLSQIADQNYKIRKRKALEISSTRMLVDMRNLKHFGKFINLLFVRDVYLPYVSYEQIFQAIANFSSDRLKWISLDCNFDESLTDKSFKCLEKVLKNVGAIQLYNMNDENHFELLLSYCENLKEVELDGEEMELKGLWCSKNVSITSLTLSGLQNDDILKEVSKNLVNLESLVYECAMDTSDKISHLCDMRNLRRLRIKPKDNNIGQVLQNFANKNVLEYLHVSEFHMSKTLANSFGHFPNLNELVLEDGGPFGANKSQILSKKLVNIKKLYIVECIGITLEDVTKIIENLLGLKCITIVACYHIDAIDRDNYLRLTKPRDLQIAVDTEVYQRTTELIGNYFSADVRVTVNREDKEEEYEFFGFHVDI